MTKTVSKEPLPQSQFFSFVWEEFTVAHHCSAWAKRNLSVQEWLNEVADDPFCQNHLRYLVLFLLQNHASHQNGEKLQALLSTYDIPLNNMYDTACYCRDQALLALLDQGMTELPTLDHMVTAIKRDNEAALRWMMEKTTLNMRERRYLRQHAVMFGASHCFPLLPEVPDPVLLRLAWWYRSPLLEKLVDRYIPLTQVRSMRRTLRQLQYGRLPREVYNMFGFAQHLNASPIRRIYDIAYVEQNAEIQEVILHAWPFLSPKDQAMFARSKWLKGHPYALRYAIKCHTKAPTHVISKKM